MPKKGNMQVPIKWSGQDRRFAETLKNSVDILAGFNGDPLDRAITARDLLDSGIATLAAGSTVFSGGSADLALTSPGNLPTYDVPPTPTNLSADGAFQNIIVTWNLESYAGHSYVEVYRHTSDAVAAATLIAQVSGTVAGIYADSTGPTADFYYWVRAVNENGVAGPFNSSVGTRGQTAPDVTFLLTTLNGAITSSELANSLTTQLSGYDTDIAALETTFGTTVSAATSAAAAAASESAAIAAKASALGAETGAVAAKVLAIGAETGAIAAKASALGAETGAVAAETAAIGAKDDAVIAKVAALAAQTNAETAETSAETAETNAETAQSAAETAQTAASTSATGALGSAASASTSQTAAATSATEAGSSASAAATSESNASTYATNAGTGATASETSRLAAETAESNAETSEDHLLLPPQPASQTRLHMPLQLALARRHQKPQS